MSENIPRILIVPAPDTGMAIPTLAKLANYLHYQYPATTGDIMLNKLCEDIAQLTLAYQSSVADGLELKRQRDEWGKDAERLIIKSSVLHERQLLVIKGVAERIELKGLQAEYDEALTAHNTLLEQMKEKKV